MDELENMEEPQAQEEASELPQLKKKYKTVTCKKCGVKYPSLYKECPECGFSLTRQILKVVIIAALVLGLLAADIILIIRVNKLEAALDEISAKVETIDNANQVDITTLDYYKENLIYSGANLSAFGDDYLIYALQDGCSACAETNQYVYMFLYYGYPDFIPMYFVTPDSADDIFFEKLNCEHTPTLYRMKGDQIIEKVEGVDEVYSMLDSITSEANSSTGEKN